MKQYVTYGVGFASLPYDAAGQAGQVLRNLVNEVNLISGKIITHNIELINGLTETVYIVTVIYETQNF